MRSLVCWGIESATADRFITSDTVAGDRPSSSASSFKLTRAPGFPPRRALFDPDFFFTDTVRSIAKADCKRQAGGRKIGHRSFTLGPLAGPPTVAESRKSQTPNAQRQPMASAFQLSNNPVTERQTHPPRD